MAYTWDKKLLKDLSKIPEARKDLHALFAANWDIFRISQSEKLSKSQTVIEDYEYLSNYRYAQDYLVKMLNFPDIILSDYKYQNKLTADDAMALVHDFYAQTPPEIHRIFQCFYDQRHTHFRFNKSLLAGFYSGKTYASPSTGDFFFEVRQVGTIQDAIITTHEYGHGIDYFMSPLKDKPECYWAYDEVTSIFLELIAMDFWDTYSEFKEDIENERKRYYADLVRDSRTLFDKVLITYEVEDLLQQSEEYDPSFTQFFASVRENLNMSRSQLNSVLKNPASVILPYTLSTLVALELYHIYQTDRDFAFHLYRRFMHLKAESAQELDEKINAIGLHPTENIATFTRKLSI